MQNIESFYPLSPMQQGMLFHTLYNPGSTEYFRRISCVLEGPLDVGAFRSAWHEVVKRHPVLRTSFVWEGLKEPIQVVQRDVGFPWQELDWRQLPSAEQQEQWEKFLKKDEETGFDLSRPPLVRFALIQISANCHRLVWSLHHIILDGWSMPLLLREVFARYEGALAKKKPEIGDSLPYRDYIVWLRQQDANKAETHWRTYLHGFTAPTPLTVDGTSSPDQPVGYAQFEVTLSSVESTRLAQMARRQRVTLNTLVQGAWAILLSRYSGEPEVVFGATVAGRPPALAGVDRMVGLFINSLPVRVQVQSHEPVTDWLQQLQTQQAESRNFEYSSLADIQGWSELPPREPLFESIVVFENYPTDDFLSKDSGGLRVRDVQSLEWNTFPLTVQVLAGNELKIAFVYDRRRFEPSAISRMASHYCRLLEDLAAKPEQSVSTVSLLSETERQNSLVQWNNTAVDYQCGQLVPQLIEAQVQRTPDNPAVRFADQELTFCQLNRRANQLAHYLRERGIERDSLVGISMERSIEMVVALLGVMKAGAAYVPLDPEYPEQRLRFMLRDADAPVLLTEERLLGRFSEQRTEIVCLDRDRERIDACSEENLRIDLRPEDLAYVIYTSGSTGQPKGAMNTHGGLLNRLLWMQREYGLNGEDRVMQKTPFSFDVSVWEFFWPLMTGACMVVARPGGHRDPGYLAELIAKEKVTTLHFVPSMLHAFL